MKKFLLSLGLIGIGIFGGLCSTTYASNNDCKEVEFANGVNACVNIQQGDDNDEWELETDVDNGSTTNLRCDLMTPDSILRSIPSCNGIFSYDEDDEGTIKLWIRYNNAAPTDWEDKPNNDSKRTYPQWAYDFDEEERGDANYSSSSNGDLESFEIKLSDSTPAEDDEVTLTIKALDEDDDVIDDYEGDDAEITVYYRTSSSSSWKIASSSYVSIDDKTPTFKDGIAKTDITFKYEYEYKIFVEDDNEDISDYKVFDVGGSSSSSNGDLESFEIKLSDSTPAEDDEVTLTIKALDEDDDVIDDYEGDDAEITVYYRTSSSSSWKIASSSYVSIDDKTPTFDNGEAETDITFKYDYEYKILVEDDDEDISDYKVFDVGGSSSSTANLESFEIKLSDSTPAEDDEVTLTIKALDEDDDGIDDYDGDRAEITVYYRTSSSSSWKTASSSYVSIDDKTPTFKDGIAKTDITFKYEYEYKILVTDSRVGSAENISDYKVFDVGGSSSSSNGDLESFEIKLSDSTPAEDDEVTLTIKALDEDDDVIDDYEGDDAEITVYYRTSSSSSWKIASSSYVSIDDKTPTFKDGIAKTDITFKYEYEYKIFVEDDDEDISDYKVFDVGGSSSSSNGDLESFEIKLSDSTPAEDDEVTLTIKALDEDDDGIDDYDGDNAEIKIYYKKTSSASTWITATNSYVSIDDKTPTFDNGEAETDITFKYAYYYLIVVIDSDANVANYKTVKAS